MVRSRLAILAALAIALATTGRSHAQDAVPRRAVSARFEGGVARVSARLGDLADASLRQRLSSGLPQTLDTRVFAYRGSAGVPIAASARSCRITYDPWGLSYRVQIQTPFSDRTESMSSIERVLDACLHLDDVAIGTPRDWSSARGADVWFAGVVELNPLSPETVHRLRRWLARPDGSRVEGDAFFGSFVSLFVNRHIGEAERVLRFRSADEVRSP